MSQPWTGTSAPAASSQATVTIVAPASAGAVGQVIRMRYLSASVAGATATTSTLQVSDGSTVLMSLDMAPPAAGGVSILPVVDLMDYRTTIPTPGSSGNNLVVAFASGASGITQKINVQGDYVQQGAPANNLYTA